MGYRIGVAVVVGLHYLYLAYLVGGGFLAWRFPRTILLHVAAAVWGVVITFAPVVCPLTWLHDWLRHQLGEPSLRGGFIAHYVTGVFYPDSWAAAVRVAVAVVVAISWVGFARRHQWPLSNRGRARRTNHVARRR